MIGKRHNRSIVLFVVMLTAFLAVTLIQSRVSAAAKVSISKASVTMYVGGGTETLTLKGASKPVSWSSSNKNVVTVSSSGKLTAKKVGTATVTAVHNNKKYTCKVTVKKPYLNKTSITLNPGDTFQLKLTGVAAKSYASDMSSIASVNKNGKITVKKAGIATITVTGKDNKKYTCKVTVKDVKISLNVTSGILPAGSEYRFIPKGAKATEIKWSSSDKMVAQVDHEGVVRGNRAGKATITATYKNSKATCTIDVVDFSFNSYGNTLEPGEYYKLGVTPLGKKVSYTWESLDTSKATVDKNGTVYAVPGKGGEVEIRITYNALNGKGYKSTTVNVQPFASLYTFRNINIPYKTATKAVTNSFSDGMDADISLLDFDFDQCSSAYYEHVCGMATVSKDNYDYYFVTDTWNNRVIVFRVKENETWNGADSSSNIYCVLGQKNTTSRVAGYSLGNLNWPVGVAATVVGNKIKVFVTDAKNNRILVWEDLPGDKQHGKPADFSIMQKYDTSKMDYHHNSTSLINNSTAAIAWPWGVWTDGKRLICTSTQDGYVLIWDDKLPTVTDKYPDKIIYTTGTPRNILCKDNYLLLGDHNIRTDDGREMAATRVFNDITKLKYTAVYNKENPKEKLFDYCQQKYDFVYTDNNSMQPSGTFLNSPLKTDDGSILKKGTLLLHEAGMIGVWKDGKIDNENDRPDYYVGGGTVDDDRIHYFIGGDSSPLIQDKKGNIYTSGLNTGKIEGYKSGTFPSEPADIDFNNDEVRKIGGDVVIYQGAYYWNRWEIGVIEKHCIQMPNICIGANSVDEVVNDTLFNYQNCIVDSNGKYLVALSDYNQQIYLWKNLPDESGAKPDVIYTFKYSVEDIIMFDNNGKTGLIVVGRDRLYGWNDIGDAFKNKKPDYFSYKKIGTVELQEIISIDYCDGYFYMVDRNKLYIFKGLPGKNDAPVAFMELPFDEANIHVTKCNDGNTYVAFGAQSQAYIINTADILAGNGEKNNMTIEGAWQKTIRSRNNGVDWVEDGYRTFNGASEVFITATGQVIVSDTGFCRVIIWNSIADAISEFPERTKKSVAILGLGDYHYTNFDVRDADPSNTEFDLIYDEIAIESRNTFFTPKFIDYDGKYLWIGDFKFSGGIKRFSGILR